MIKIKLIIYNILIKYFVKSTENYIKLSVLFSFKSNDFKPLQCTKCGSNNFKIVTVDFIDYIETEKEAICINCNSKQGYWSYGHWMD